MPLMRSLRSRRKLVLLSALLLTAAAVPVLRARSSPTKGNPVNAPIQLDAMLVPGTCKASATSNLVFYAQGLERMAHARMQRSVFAPGEGPCAIALMAEAEHCFRRAGNGVEQARAHQQWRRWKDELTARFLKHRLQLGLALKAGQRETALREIETLLTLLAGSSSDDAALTKYRDWLEFEQRRLSSQQGERQ